MENLTDIQAILAALTDTSAKRRERTIEDLTPYQVQDPRILDRLQRIVSTDPVEYVRNAARAALVENGITPAPSAAEIDLREEGITKPALFATGVTAVVIACVVVACIAMVVVLIMMSNAGFF